MSESTPTSEMMNSTATVTRIIFLYCNFPLETSSKYCPQVVVSPIAVVRQAKQTASPIASCPHEPSKVLTMVVKIAERCAVESITVLMLAPLYARVEYTTASRTKATMPTPNIILNCSFRFKYPRRIISFITTPAKRGAPSTSMVW